MTISSVGNRGINASTANNQPSLAIAVNGNVAVGRCLVVLVAVDNIVTANGAVTTANAQTSGVTDAAGNTYALAAGWNIGGGGAQAGAEVTIWLANVTAQLNSGQAITATFRTAASADATAMTAWEFQVAAANTLAIGLSAGSVSASGIPSLTVTTANETLLRVRASASEHLSATNWTGTASWTQFINTVSGAVSTLAEMAIRGEWIVSTGTTQASAPTLAGTYDSAHVYATFREVLGPVSGTLDVDDTADAAALTGTVEWPEITGTMDTTEPADDATMTGDNGEVLPGAWYTVWDLGASGRQVNAGWVGYTIVGILPLANLSQTGGSQIRLTFNAPYAGEDSEYSAVYIGNGGGTDPYDFGDTPVQVTVGSSATVHIGIDAVVVSDPVAFVKDATNPLVIAVQFENASADNAVYTNDTGTGTLYWGAGSQAGLQDKSGYSNVAAGVAVIAKVELFIGEPTDVTGTLDGDEPADVLAATGEVAWPEITGTLAVDDVADDPTLTGTVAWQGSLATTDVADIASITAQVDWRGPLATTEPADTFAATGLVLSVLTGPFATTEPADSFAATGNVISGLSGSMAVPELPDNFASTGQVTGIAGTFAATDVHDTLSSTGQVDWRASLAATDPADGMAMTGAVRWLASLATTEPADTVNITAAVRWLATFGTTEPADSVSMTGVAMFAVTGTLGTTEAADSFAASGSALSGLGGTLLGIEPPDTAAMAGQVTGAAGALAVTEMRDTLFGTGKVAWQATLVATEPADIVSMTVTARTLGTMAATDGPDSAAMSGLLSAYGTMATEDLSDLMVVTGNLVTNAALAVTEPPDTARFTSAPVSIQEAEGHFLRSAFPRVRTLESGEHRIRSLKYPVPRPRQLLNNYGQRVRELDGGRTRTFEVA